MQTMRTGRLLAFEDSDRLVMRKLQDAHPVLELGRQHQLWPGDGSLRFDAECRRDNDLPTPPSAISNNQI